MSRVIKHELSRWGAGWVEEGGLDGEEVVVFGKGFLRKTGNAGHKGYFSQHHVHSEVNPLGFMVLGK